MSSMQRILLYSLLLVLAVASTIVSFQFVSPADCQRLCSEPAQAPCPSGACRFGEQKAGFPFPMVQDAETGSPTGGWGKIGREDYLYLNLLAFFGNILFYGGIFWLLIIGLIAIRTKSLHRKRTKLVSVLTYVGAGLLLGFLTYRPAPAWPPPEVRQPELLILGTWRGTEPASGATTFLRFYNEEWMGRQQVLWSQSREETGNGGDYSWVDDDRLHIHVVSRYPGTRDVCAGLPILLAEACNSQVFRPTASPRGEQFSTPTAALLSQQSTPVEPSAPLSPILPTVSPTLPPYDTVESTIDLLVTVTVDAETLTLHSTSGRVYTFQRVTEKQ